MKEVMKKSLSFLLLLFCLLGVIAPSYAQNKRLTYCNPLNIDYGYCRDTDGAYTEKHRTTADPVIILFKGVYFLFSTNQIGYWWSDDLYNWNFISRSFLKPGHEVLDDLCAPAAFVLSDTFLVLGSTHERGFPLWMSTNPKADEWNEIIDTFEIGAWDPAFYADDDGRLYLYWGSSNLYPIYGIEIDRHTFKPVGEPKELIRLDDNRFGWQRFGELLDNTYLDPFIEGSWMNKHNGIYYLQYGAPGTEFSGYADGVMTGTHPLGPFVPQEHNPFSYKPGGFVRGAGHGCTFRDKWDNWWHISTMVIAVKNNFERRLGIWPAGFDKDGVLFCNTAFGDYPHYLPAGPEDHLQSSFSGWMLLNYCKPVNVSSMLEGYLPNYAVDENIKTYWSATTGNKGEWIMTDMGSICTIHAIQINYADQEAEFNGKQIGIYHQYILLYSVNGKNWKLLIDKSKNRTDVPHDYIELDQPVQARYIKLQNIHVPTGKFSISGLRVFGTGSGNIPDTVRNFVVYRGEKDRRNAWIKWSLLDNAYAYNIYFGIAPDKLYGSIMVCGSNEYYFKGLDKEKEYYFSIEAINENGISPKTNVVVAK
jgi:xylan 1,4-beta-xylosidase